jgi:predicted RNA methylase
MKISEATALIRTPLIEWVRPQDWCDLGCGTGTFTTALAELLAPGSTIHAVDLDQKMLEEIRTGMPESKFVRFWEICGVLACAFHRSMEFSWRTPCTSFGSNTCS